MAESIEIKRPCLKCHKDYLPSESSSETGKFCQECADFYKKEDVEEKIAAIDRGRAVLKHSATFSLTGETTRGIAEIQILEHLKNASAVIGFLVEKYYATWKPKEKNGKSKKA